MHTYNATRTHAHQPLCCNCCCYLPPPPPVSACRSSSAGPDSLGPWGAQLSHGQLRHACELLVLLARYVPEPDVSEVLERLLFNKEPFVDFAR